MPYPTITIQLTTNSNNDLIAILPQGTVTLGDDILKSLENIFNVELKIRRTEAAFYGEPSTKQLAKDLKSFRNSKTQNVLDLELDI